MNFKNLISGKKKEAGFTLVELMVVVAIIALLAATAIPQFRKYQAKARSSEAKLALASLYTAMESYYAEYNHYMACLGFMGYAPSGTGAERYYWSGFSITSGAELSTPTACSGTASATALSYAYEGGKVPGGAASMTIVALTDSYVSDNYGFTAGTAGIIDKDFSLTGTVSKFHINDLKALTNTQIGY